MPTDFSRTQQITNYRKVPQTRQTIKSSHFQKKKTENQFALVQTAIAEAVLAISLPKKN